MTRTINATLKSTLANGNYDVYFRAFLYLSGTLTFTLDTIIEYKLTPDTLHLKAKYTYGIDDYDQLDTIVLRRGVTVNGTPYYLDTSNFMITSAKIDLNYIIIEAELFSHNSKISVNGFGTTAEVLNLICSAVNKTAILKESSQAFWNNDFLPAGKILSLNKAKQLKSLLKQKIFGSYCDNGYDTATAKDSILFFAQKRRPYDYDGTNVPEYTITVDGILTKTDNQIVNTGFVGLQYMDENKITYQPTGANTIYPIYNIGYLHSSDVLMTESAGAISDTSLKLKYMPQLINPVDIPINLEYQTGDYVDIISTQYASSFHASGRLLVTEYLDLNTKTRIPWGLTIELWDYIANTEGGALPSTIEHVGAYTQLVSTGFDGNLTPAVNNFPAFPPALHNIPIGRETLTEDRTYYVGYDVGTCAISVASPGVVTKAGHGLENDDSVVFSFLLKMRTITVTIASPAVVTSVGHGFAANQPIVFRTTGALPTGITAGTTYYVISAGLAADTFRFSTSIGGAAVNTSGSQSGTHYLETVGTLPTGLTEGVVYYVVNKATDTFEVSATVGGASINTSGTTTGIPSIMTGNDANDGLSTGRTGAYLTPQKAIDQSASLDMSIYSVVLQLADGYHEGLLQVKNCIGAGTVTVQGNATYPGNVHLNLTSNDINQGTITALTIYTIYIIKDLMLTCSGTRNFLATNSLYITFSNLVFGISGSHQISSVDGAYIEATGNYMIVGGATQHLNANHGNIRCQSITITLLNTPNFTQQFATSVRNGLLNLPSNTFQGSATGKKYVSNSNAVLETNGAGSNYLPGNSAGTTDGFGIYT